MGWVLATSISPMLWLLAQDAGPRPPSYLPTPTAVAQEPPYRLKPRPDGGYEYDDTRFKAVIAPDGTVSFDDHHIPNKWHLIPLLPQNNPPGTQTLEGALRELLQHKPVGRSQLQPDLPERPHAAGPMTEADRRAMEEYYYTVPFMTNIGSADLADEYYRMLDEDPYRYEKARFLSSTTNMRLKMAAESQIRDMRLALHDLPGRLDRLWKDPTQPPAVKRLMICALWSELYHDERGREATNVINHFVRTRLPLGSTDAYTPAELDSCNATAEPPAKFDPYTPPPPRKPSPRPSATPQR